MLDARLRHVLVDEFQDTSEAQVQLLQSLTAGWERGDGRTLFLVGDPMQSIYRFRNAEVGLFLDVRDRGLGDIELEPLTLRVNFRSTQPIVQWVNQCFARVLPPRDDVLRGAVKYSESVAAPQATDEGGVHVHAFLRSSRRFEAQTVADIIERRHAEKPDARIAILVQGRSHLLDIVAELARRGIRFQATDIDPLGARPAVLDLLALTRALAHLGDRAAWIGVLRAPWCGLTLADCLALLGGDRHASVPRLLREEPLRQKLEAAARAPARTLPAGAGAGPRRKAAVWTARLPSSARGMRSAALRRSATSGNWTRRMPTSMRSATWRTKRRARRWISPGSAKHCSNCMRLRSRDPTRTSNC